MNRKVTKFILIITFILGISILLYPTLSRYINSFASSKAVTDYNKMLETEDEIDYASMFEEAKKYNKKLLKLDFPLVQYKEIPNYSNLLNVNGNGMMGYISIDKINVELPIYHGTSSSTLNTSVGHLEGSSLPIGGKNNHSVLSAHRGLPSAKLFTNLNKLEVGDTFTVTVLNRKLTYQIDNIVVVKPTEAESLEIVKNKDYVTLMTCTPYGINTHRLLVRGIRIENEETNKMVLQNEAEKIDKLVVALSIAGPILFSLTIYVMVKPIKKETHEEEEI